MFSTKLLSFKFCFNRYSRNLFHLFRFLQNNTFQPKVLNLELRPGQQVLLRFNHNTSAVVSALFHYGEGTLPQYYQRTIDFWKTILSLPAWQSNSVLSLLIMALKHFRKHFPSSKCSASIKWCLLDVKTPTQGRQIVGAAKGVERFENWFCLKSPCQLLLQPDMLI